jgi:hypothetical protein
MLSPSRTRTRDENLTYIPFALLALWFTALIFHAISSEVFSSLSPSTSTSIAKEQNLYEKSNSTNQKYQPQLQPQQISILNLTTLLFLGLFTSLIFLLSFTHLLLHLQSLYPKRYYGAIALFLFALSGLICFGVIVTNNGSASMGLGFSGYVESIVWPGLGVMSVFVMGVLGFDLEERDRKKALEGGELDVEAEGENGSEEVVVEGELERRLESIEVDLEKGIGGTEGDGEEECEVVGEEEPMIRKGKEKEKEVEIAEDAEDCEDADFVQVPRK